MFGHFLIKFDQHIIKWNLRVDPKQDLFGSFGGLEQSSYHILLQALVVSEGPKAIFCEYLGLGT